MQNKNRSKLKKYMGKRERYIATVSRKSGGNRLLIDVKKKNRDISDHIWVDGEKFSAFEEGEVVTFMAYAYTYTDAKGIRKNGLKKAQWVSTLEFFKTTTKRDSKEKHKRLGWKRK